MEKDKEHTARFLILKGQNNFVCEVEHSRLFGVIYFSNFYYFLGDKEMVLPKQHGGVHCDIGVIHTTSGLVKPQIRIRFGLGGKRKENSCWEQYVDDTLDCYLKYPEDNDSHNNFNEVLRESCLDSAAAAYRLCKTGKGIGLFLV